MSELTDEAWRLAVSTHFLAPVEKFAFRIGFEAGRASVTPDRDALAEIISELDKIEDRQYHDIDGMISTVPWAKDIVNSAKRIRRLAAAVIASLSGEK